MDSFWAHPPPLSRQGSADTFFAVAGKGSTGGRRRGDQATLLPRTGKSVPAGWPGENTFLLRTNARYTTSGSQPAVTLKQVAVSPDRRAPSAGRGVRRMPLAA